MSKQSSIAIGIDLGGTSIKGGLIQSDGLIVEKRSIPTEADGGPDHVMVRMETMIKELANASRTAGRTVSAVGLGVPGTLSHSRGVVIAPPNLPGWRDVPIVERLSKATGYRVTLENDANAAAWGEFVCGAGRGTKSMIMITLGTGVGGGFIFDGSLFHGSHDGGGEIGHMIVVSGGRLCACGQRGCLEAYISANQTAARASERLLSGEPSTLTTAKNAGRAITSEDVVAAAAKGDALATAVWNETCEWLATACVNLQQALDPERFVLAGGMSIAGEQLLTPVRAAARRLISPTFGRPPQIDLATLGTDAGIVGAALCTVDISK